MKSGAEVAQEEWLRLVTAIADALFADDVADLHARAGDRVRAANQTRLAIGSTGFAWNLALEVSDEAFAPVGAALAQSCGLLAEALEARLRDLVRGHLHTAPTRRQVALAQRLGLALVSAAELARSVIRLRGGSSEQIRDVAEIYTDIFKPLENVS